MLTQAQLIDPQARTLTVKIKRYNPEHDEKPHWEEFQVEADGHDRVLDVIQKVKWEQDDTLSLRRSCAHGVCGSDAMRINGSNGLACKILVKNLRSDTLTLEPILGLPVIKDLIVDMKPFFDHYKAVMPFLINDEPPPTTERIQSPAERARFDDSTKCILCACCTTACPPFWGDQASTSARRRSSTPTASSSTRETGARPSVSRSSTTPRGSGGAGPSSTARAPAPATSRSPRPSPRSSGP